MAFEIPHIRGRFRCRILIGCAEKPELGFEGTWSDVDVWANRVEQGVVVATPETLAAVEERYGDAVILYPEFRPVED